MQTVFPLVRAVVLALVIGTILMMLIANITTQQDTSILYDIQVMQAMTVLQTMALTLLLFKPSD